MMVVDIFLNLLILYLSWSLDGAWREIEELKEKVREK